MAPASTDRVPRRIIIDVSPFSDHRDEAFDDPDKTSKLIIKSISRYDTRVVFDLFHDTFDPALAHLQGQDPPVCVVSLRHGKRRKAYPANRSQELKVNFEIRFLHNRYGTGCEPPFSEDSRRGSAWSIPFKDFRDYDEYCAQMQDMIKLNL